MAELLYKTIPFLSLALVLFGFALIEALRTRWRDMDLMTMTIIFAGIAGGLYALSLALNFSPLAVQWRPWWFHAIRISLWGTVPGLLPIYRNVKRAWQARRSGVFREKLIYDTPTNEENSH